ncbi:MAG: polyprenyl synthetase family protein [Treponema sp.]|jgi:octaprenyl-diphosphate synthase|nr:polyprenyl synthetase family protein [Treponema sp.]
MEREYIRRLEKIEALLRQGLPESPHPSWRAAAFADIPPVPPDLIRSLCAPGWDLLNRGGKRWRPLLMTLICEALGGGDGALPLIPLVEFPHNASLIHDDIEDNSDTRRGRPAVHLIYGADTAINGGCFLYFLPLICVEAWSGGPERKNRIYQVWGEHMRRLHLGQAMDISWHRNFDSQPEIETYYAMCGLKTGCLARLAAVLGVYAADARLHGGSRGTVTPQGEALAGELGDAAEKLGVGFQILDDVKNLTTGNPGKKRGDDVAEGKKSLPVLLYLRGGGGRNRLVSRCFAAARKQGAGASEVEELITALETAGALEEAREQGKALISEAGAALGELPFTGFAENAGARRLLAELPPLIS